MKINSIRFKTSILFSSILCAILLVNGIFIYFGLKRILYRDLDNELSMKVERIANILNAYAEAQDLNRHPFSLMRSFVPGQPEGVSIVKELWEADVKMMNLKKDFFRIINLQGQIMFSSTNLTKEINEVLSGNLPRSINGTSFTTVNGEVIAGRMVNYPFLYQNRIPMIIQLLAPTASLHGILNELVLFMFLSIALIVLFTSFLGSYLARSILKPVASVTSTANKISHSDLSFRIDDKEIDGEMKDLIRSFNMMITRLEASFAHINDFSSHVAHELKTPLAIIRGEIELTLSEENIDKEGYRRTLEDTLNETDRLIRIIKDLLLLAKLDYRPEIFKFEQIDFSSFIRNLFSQVEILAMEKEIVMMLDLASDKIMIEADPVHLRRLFLNLINNAIKFSPQQGKVEILVRKDPKELTVQIKDSGPGISESDLDKIFMKFYRVPGDTVDSPGNGLGLPIAQSIAKAHKGYVSVQSKVGEGSIFTVFLPLDSV